MKEKYHNEKNILNYITSTEKYKIIFFLSMLLALYGGFGLGSSVKNFFDSILVPLQFPIFNILLFAIIITNNIYICSILKKEFAFYIGRLNNKTEYVKTVMRISTIMYLFNIMIILLFLLACLLLTNFDNMEIYNYSNFMSTYTISNLLYCIFFLFRYIILGLLIINISTLLYLNFNQYVTLLFSSIFLTLMFYYGNIMSITNTYTINIWSYFALTTFTSFSLELSSSVLMILIMEIIMLVLKHLTYKNKRIEVL